MPMSRTREQGLKSVNASTHEMSSYIRPNADAAALVNMPMPWEGEKKKKRNLTILVTGCYFLNDSGSSVDCMDAKFNAGNLSAGAGKARVGKDTFFGSPSSKT